MRAIIIIIHEHHNESMVHSSSEYIPVKKSSFFIHDIDMLISSTRDKNEEFFIPFISLEYLLYRHDGARRKQQSQKHKQSMANYVDHLDSSYSEPCLFVR